MTVHKNGTMFLRHIQGNLPLQIEHNQAFGYVQTSDLFQKLTRCLLFAACGFRYFLAKIYF